MDIREYSFSDEIKKQLGYIIRENRKSRLNNLKNSTLIENNPYTKENFCENNLICHYHTLTKLENDVVKDDSIYHLLLKKLDLYFQVTQEEHENNIAYIDSIAKKLLYAGEYIDDDLAKTIKDEIEHVYYNKDVIAEYNIKLLKVFIKLQLVLKLDDDDLSLLINYRDFYQGLYQGIVTHCLGVYYLNKLQTEKAKKCFLLAKDVYEKHNISKGLISSYLIAVYVYTNNYYESVPLCNKMELFYIETKNYKRLMHVYNYLSDYYFLINALDVARDYFNKALKIIDNDESLERYKYSIYYNWGFRCFKDNRFEEALEYLLTANEVCKANNYKLQTINMILIMMTKLRYPVNEIKKIYLEGEKYIEFSNDSNLSIFKYFRFKLKNSKYYRKYAIDKILPMLRDDRSKMEILLFFYEDLYK